jgi:hypothetical protein
MIPINNSDTAWLIVSDYNQDNSIGYPDCLRDDIANPEVNVWYYEFENNTAGVGESAPISYSVGLGSIIGGQNLIMNFSDEVGSSLGEIVGGHYEST